MSMNQAKRIYVKKNYRALVSIYQHKKNIG